MKKICLTLIGVLTPAFILALNPIGDVSKITKHSEEVEQREACLWKTITEPQKRIQIRAIIMAMAEKGVIPEQAKKESAVKAIKEALPAHSATELLACLGLTPKIQS